MWHEELPDGIHIDEPLRLCVEADLHPDGSFGREWLAVTDSRLFVFSENGGPVEQRWDLPLKDLVEPKPEMLVGGGMLEVKRDGVRLELVRYSASRVARFATVAGLLDKWSKGEEAEVPPEEEKYCPRCGLPLEQGSKVCPGCLPKSRTLKRLLGYLGPYWKAALGLGLVAASGAALSLLPPWLNVPLFDRALAPKTLPLPTKPERLHVLILVVGVYAASQVLGAAFQALQGWLSAWLGNRVTHSVRCELYEHLQYLSLSFFDKRQMGTVISRVNQDTGQLQGFLVSGSQDLIHNFMTLIGIGIMLFVINWKLALLVLVPSPAVAVGMRLTWKRIRYYMHRLFNRWGRLNAVLSETLNGLRVVKVFAQEPREIARFQERSLDLAFAGVHTERMWSLLFSGIGLFIGLGILLVQWLGGVDVIGNTMTLGHFIAFMSYVGMFFGPVRWMSMLLNWATRSMTAAERVFEIVDTKAEVEEQEDAVAMPHIEGKVEFRDVTFGYEKHNPALKHVSFTANPDEMIGLVGHSGAGKTTTINLLCRFYDVDEGEILVDGVPINKIRVEDLRHQIGVVPQDTFLFSGTIVDNIAYAKPGATREEIISAAKIANAHDFILRKPDGYETFLGEGGSGLSAGERQRLAIARAVLHNPRILILDEATSQVDVETEHQIQEAIQRLVSGRTTFAIAHRLSTLKNADRLLVLKAGEISEMGTHDELLAKEEGEFHRLVKAYQEVSKVREVAR